MCWASDYSAYNSISGEYGYLYSDDGGETWGFIETSLGGSGNFAEAQIVELGDGYLRTYMRTNTGKIGYISSTDGGNTWSDTQYIPGISVASYGTQLSVIKHSEKLMESRLSSCLRPHLPVVGGEESSLLAWLMRRLRVVMGNMMSIGLMSMKLT